MRPCTREADDAYYISGKWKCKKSPTKAHYWKIEGDTSRCVYCPAVRAVDTRTVYQIARGNYVNQNW